MRKLASLLLALVLVFGLATTAFAAGGVEEPAGDEPAGSTTTTGTITIDNAVDGQTYTIYKLLELESYDATKGTYAYKTTTAWDAWLRTQTTYVTVTTDGYVTWNTGADAAAFAKLAKAYAATNSIANQGSTTATATTVTFNNLELGYYLVDSTLGTLCSMDTTNPTVTIKEKNAVPTNEKKVEEDSNNTYGSTNDADLGQTVNFKSTITAQAGAENYVFHDKMSAGLTYTGVTGITLNGTTVATSNYTVKTTDLTDDCTFEVVFTQAFCYTLKANDQIVISYTAKLNENAVVGLNGNPNESKLSYGDSSNTSTNTTPPSKTITYTWDMDVLKYANGTESNVLQGVKFVLIKKVTSDGTTTEYVAKVSGGKLTGWDEVSETTTWSTEHILTTDDKGKISVDGLDADTYYLREIETLPGFNILSGDQEVKIDGATKAKDSDELTYTTKLVKINNQSGTELPSTGGIGTTLFYIAGGVLVVGAAVLLVTKRRMER